VSIVCPKSSSSGRSRPKPGKEAEATEALVFVERWESRELLDAHLESEHVAKVLEQAEELFGDSADIVVYERLAGGERKGSLAKHAAG
jgi:quinol monooxygenase YgiN